MRQIYAIRIIHWAVIIHLLLMSGGQGSGGAGWALADDVTDGLIKRIEEHQAAIANLAFVYDVESSFASPLGKGDGRTRKTREVFRLAKPPAQDQSQDWLAWEILTEVEEGHFRTDWFHVSDGKNTWKFSREAPSLMLLFGSSPKNRGSIDVGFSNQVWTHNVFGRMLFMEINGGWPLLDPQNKSLAGQRQFRTIGKTTFLDKPAFVLERKHPSIPLLYRATVLDEPQAMVLRFQTLDMPSNRSLADFKVEQIKTIGKIAYPAKGLYELAESDGRYEFKVEDVILAKDNRDGWCPAWPPGTIVRDVVNDREFEAKGGEKVGPEIERRH